MPVIYIDVLLALNLWIDFILLLATARILRLPRRRWRPASFSWWPFLGGGGCRT